MSRKKGIGERSMKKTQELIEQETAFLKVLLDPAIDRVVESLPESTATKEEQKQALFKFLENREESERTQAGFETVIAHLHRVSGGQHVEKELRQAGERLINQVEDLVKNHSKEIQENLHTLQKKCQKGEPLFEPDPSSQLTVEESLAAIVPCMDAWGISQESFATMYEVGRTLFSEGEIDHAFEVFEFLSMLNVKCPEVWFSLGLCAQRKQEWPKALTSYALAISINPTYIPSFLNLAVCYRALQDFDNAAITLELAENVLATLDLQVDEKNDLYEEIANVRRG